MAILTDFFSAGGWFLALWDIIRRPTVSSDWVMQTVPKLGVLE